MNLKARQLVNQLIYEVTEEGESSDGIGVMAGPIATDSSDITLDEGANAAELKYPRQIKELSNICKRSLAKFRWTHVHYLWTAPGKTVWAVEGRVSGPRDFSEKFLRLASASDLLEVDYDSAAPRWFYVKVE